MRRINGKPFIYIIILFSYPIFTWASSALGVGAVAQNLMDPVTFFSNFIRTCCFLVGGLFLFASIVKYFEHRRSPLMVTFGTVVFLFIAGIVLILLPLLADVTQTGGVQYRL